MSEATIIKPISNARLTAQAQHDQTVIMLPSSSSSLAAQQQPRARDYQHPLLNNNPLVDEAAVILSLISQIRCTTEHHDIASLRAVFIDHLQQYQYQLQQHQLASNTIAQAAFCLCCFIDETVMNSPWGNQSLWGAESLLSHFHAQTRGGDYFYELLDQCLRAPQAHLPLLELQFLCLSLGFVGKMRLMPQQGQIQIKDYRQQCYQALSQFQAQSTASRPSIKPLASSVNTAPQMPSWIILSVFGVAILALYLFSNYSIHRYSEPTFQALTQLVQWQPQVSSEVDQAQQNALHLKQRLQTEIERGLLTIQPMTDRVRIMLPNTELFEAASAEIKGASLPVLRKIALSLEATQGRILVTGHTDNQAIFTSRYPSNWHLSLARANAVASSMAIGTQLQGRLWPEGRGEGSPVASNEQASTRALNRRVEIDLLN